MEMEGGEILTTLAELIGWDRTRLLLAARGGEEVYIPMPENVTPDHWLALAVGYEAAMKVADAWQREKITLPLGPEGGSRNAQHRAVQEAAANGVPVNQIVRATGLHARTVRRIKNRRGKARLAFRPAVDPRQQKLFGDLYERHDQEG